MNEGFGFIDFATELKKYMIYKTNPKYWEAGK